ncbi:MAG: exodeoxyribonuclease V subunit gamma [Gammaproteobacteria bacterium]|nr:exodeoxyribonuclease V subunit gamma [Gammaproteobacteria bacterium]
MLGHALGIEAEFAGVAARPDLEGPPARALGRFAAFVARLDECGRRMAVPRDASGWQHELQWVVESFFIDGEDDAPALACIREAVHECLAAAEPALDGRPVDAALVRTCVESALERPGGAGGFVDGGVTFCSLVPMRSIPFQLICVLGLNEGEFPRVPPRHSFDRMGRDYRRGDRSRREDDRYLFLELLMSARRGLYLSYVGRDIRDNTERPPSVVVDDLVDYIAATVPDGPATARRQSVLERLLTEHPLQAFNEKYFKACPRYPGYDATLAAAAAVAREASPAPAFFDADLDGEPPATVTVADLCAFFANPVRHLLRHRLGLWLDEYDETFEDREPFDVHSGAAEEIRRTRLERFGERVDVDSIERDLRRRALLPHGIPGRLLLERELAGFEPLVPQIRAALEATPVADTRIELECGATRVTGVLSRLREDGLFHLCLRKMQARDRVELLVEHLAGSAAGVLPGARARLLAVDGDMELPALDPATAARWLEHFLDARREGMRRPVHFFPRAAFEFHDRGGGPGALDHARRTWLGNEHVFGEGRNVYYRRVFGDADPLDDRFVELANALLGPLADPGRVQ